MQIICTIIIPYRDTSSTNSILPPHPIFLYVNPLTLLNVNVGSLSHNVKETSHFLGIVQGFLADYPSLPPLGKLENYCRYLYSKAVDTEQAYLRQRAKVAWLKDGDQCTAFFFRRMAVRRARNRIHALEMAGGGVVNDPKMICEEIVSFYSNLLGTSSNPNIQRGTLAPFVSKRITNDEAIAMIRPVTKEEVRDVLFGFDDNKAPGPDGFNSRFFKKAWNVIGEEVTNAIADFFRTGKLVKEINSTIISLIPKVEVPKSPRDFRPISCCNVLYKIISKIMTNRICEVLNSLVDPSQTAFVPGRLIHDNVLLAQELLYGYNRKRMPERCCFKVDLMKAYDMVEWDFVVETLRELNFHPVFVEWVRECMTTTSFSININGAAEGYFRGRRGLRQGDPISPYLFVLVMQVLHGVMSNGIREDPNFRYHWKCEPTKTFMLTFADDLLLFCNADAHSVGTLQRCLANFSSLSGLRANQEKSNMFISAKARNKEGELQQAMGFPTGSLPVKYLGIPLITSKLTMAECKPLLDKVDRRVGSWSNKVLSYAGRVQLIKSVLASLHVYWASIFILPKGILRSIESKFREFLWHGGHPKVRWEDVCTSISEGGLGITPLLAQNQALMTKNVWRLITNDGSSIWVEWMRVNKLKGESFWSIPIPATCSWSWRQMLKLRPYIRDYFVYKIGNGEDFLLWRDPWHSFGILQERVPTATLITGLHMDARLSEVIMEGQWRWPATSHFDIHEICTLLPEIDTHRADRIIWKNSASGVYTTSSALPIFKPARARVRWAALLKGPGKIPKHNFILWLAIRKRLPLREKPWIGQGESDCVLCNNGHLENHNHLFFDCAFSSRCVCILRNRVRFHWPHQEWDRGVDWAARRWRGKHKVNSSYRLLFAALVYAIWRERNARVFENIHTGPDIVTIKVIKLVQDKLLTMLHDDNLQTRAIKRLWHIPW